MTYFFITFCIRIVCLSFVFVLLFSCQGKSQKNNVGIIRKTTHFYNADGEPTFTHYLKIYYTDSVVIEEIRGVNTLTDTAYVTTVTYPLLWCRYINLKSKRLYDYKNFSDTAKIFHKAILPDSLMLDGGWSFYSEKYPKIQGIPESLTDTIIENITYKRAKFCYITNDPKKNFQIGYFRCDGKGDLFSIEKDHSRKLNCTMVKYFDYKVGKPKPYFSKEVDFISESLTKEELEVFAAWGKNEKENPVYK